MAAPLGVIRWRAYFLWGMLFVYVMALICQLCADHLLTLLIVVLHDVPPALFALVHGSVLYRGKGMSSFAAICVGVGRGADSVSLRRGFPFGQYYFTDVMVRKFFQLPVLLSLAYLGIGYIAWIFVLLILGYGAKQINGTRVFAL